MRAKITRDLTTQRPLFPDLPVCERARSYSLDEQIEAKLLLADLAQAARKRQVEFLAGRDVAARAMSAIAPEHAGVTIGIGTQREPLWPVGIVGSITHSSGHAGAAVARARDCIAIGIDSEPIIALKTAAEVATTICHPAELQRIGDSLISLTIVFSAKESLYKCLGPLVRKSFEFQDAEIEMFDVISGRFSVRLLRDLHEAYRIGWQIHGRVVVDGVFVHTGIALGAPHQ